MARGPAIIMNIMNALIGKFSWRRLLRSALLIPFGVYLGLQVVLYFYADKLIFQPPRASYGVSSDITKITVGNGEVISLFYRPNPAANQTVLFIHGNAEDLGTIRPALDHLNALGVSVAAFDYRGYGMSSGTPSEAGSYEDADAPISILLLTSRSILKTLLCSDVPWAELSLSTLLAAGRWADLSSRALLSALFA